MSRQVDLAGRREARRAARRAGAPTPAAQHEAYRRARRKISAENAGQLHQDGVR